MKIIIDFLKNYNPDLLKLGLLGEHVGDDALAAGLGNLHTYHSIFIFIIIFSIMISNFKTLITLIYSNTVYLLSVLGMMFSLLT